MLQKSASRIFGFLRVRGAPYLVVALLVALLSMNWGALAESALSRSALTVGHALNTAVEAPAVWPEYSQRWRFGVGVAREHGSIDQYDVSQLCAGWYHDWGTLANPPRPEGMEYMQLVRVSPTHFDLDHPEAYDWASLDATIRANRGSVWMIGNEPDGRAPGACDIRYPRDYARIYKLFYDHIKQVDPTAKISNGPIIQATPLRMQWLTRVWDEYQTQFGSPMPVDVWNFHNQMVKEAPSEGADIPLDGDPALGRLYTVQDNDNLSLFIEHIVRMRQWMKDHGQQNKPLVLSEYGIIQPEYLGFTADRIAEFMEASFTYLLNATDANLGMPDDGYRLVQRWAWFSLNTPLGRLGTGGGWNGNLFNPETRAITEIGRAYGRFACRTTHPTPTPSTTPRASFVRREAESGSLHAGMGAGEDESASDCRYIYLAAAPAPGEEPNVTYNVYIPETADYVLWGRAYGVDYANRSFNVQVDGRTAVAWYFNTGSWSWSRMPSASSDSSVHRLEGGRWHTIRVMPRGNGTARLDALEITRDRAYTPGNASVTLCNPGPTATPTVTDTPTPTVTPTVTRTPMPWGPGRFTGNVAYQGRGEAPAAAWQAPLLVTAHLPGDPVPAYSFNTPSDQSGHFQIANGIQPGTYDLGVRNAHSLRNLLRGVSISSATQQLDFGTLLEGDANTDNRINILDFSILSSAYGTQQGEAEFDARSDFNEDDRINILDFSLLAANYGEQGDQSPAGAAPAQILSVAPLSLGTVTLRVTPASQTVATGASFNVNVYLDAGSSLVSGVELKLSFNPTYLSVLSVTPDTTQLGYVLKNQTGSNYIYYAAGSLSGPVSGSFRLFSVTLRAGQNPVASTPLQFYDYIVTSDQPGGTHTVSLQNGQITILSATPAPTASPTPLTKYLYGKVVVAGSGEGIPGVLVQLYRDRTMVREMTTDNLGRFGWSINPIAGQYQLVAQDAPGYRSVSAALAPGVTGTVIDANTLQFPLPNGSTVGEFLFTDEPSGVTPTATPTGGASPTATPTALATVTPTPPSTTKGGISGMVFEDLNGNQALDAGEPGVPGATVELRSQANALLDTRTSGPNGQYAFGDLEPGSYRLRLGSVPQGYREIETLIFVVPVQAGATAELAFALESIAAERLYVPLILK